VPYSHRLHPISVTVQRYLVNDSVIRNYMIPAKVGAARNLRHCQSDRGGWGQAAATDRWQWGLLFCLSFLALGCWWGSQPEQFKYE
jgi:hypothetical protein